MSIINCNIISKLRARLIILQYARESEGLTVFHLRKFFFLSRWNPPDRDVRQREIKTTSDCVDRRVSGCAASWAVYKRARKIHETRPFALTCLYSEPVAVKGRERERKRKIDRQDRTQSIARLPVFRERSCVRWCVPCAIRTKSYYPRIEKCVHKRPTVTVCGGPRQPPAIRGFVRDDVDRSLSHAPVVLLFMKRFEPTAFHIRGFPWMLVCIDLRRLKFKKTEKLATCDFCELCDTQTFFFFFNFF